MSTSSKLNYISAWVKRQTLTGHVEDLQDGSEEHDIMSTLFSLQSEFILEKEKINEYQYRCIKLDFDGTLGAEFTNKQHQTSSIVSVMCHLMNIKPNRGACPCFCPGCLDLSGPPELKPSQHKNTKCKRVIKIQLNSELEIRIYNLISR